MIEAEREAARVWRREEHRAALRRRLAVLLRWRALWARR